MNQNGIGIGSKKFSGTGIGDFDSDPKSIIPT
jgi:hypothetical protein